MLGTILLKSHASLNHKNSILEAKYVEISPENPTNKEVNNAQFCLVTKKITKNPRVMVSTVLAGFDLSGFI